jgi:hypothetical protein
MSRTCLTTKFFGASARWTITLVRRRVGRSLRVIWCHRLYLHRIDCMCEIRLIYIYIYHKWLQNFILIGVERWWGQRGVNSVAGGVRPTAAPRLNIYWNIYVILCWSAKWATRSTSRSALILASSSICSPRTRTQSRRWRLTSSCPCGPWHT